jgi:transcription elongation GreA/GreB family factor
MVNAMETTQPTATAEQRAPQPVRESAPTLLTRAGERALRHEAEEQVRINSEVTLRIGERTLVRTLDTGSGAAGTVSVVSPIGRAILGREVGTTVPVHLPDGRTRTVEIVAVERALSPA